MLPEEFSEDQLALGQKFVPLAAVTPSLSNGSGVVSPTKKPTITAQAGPLKSKDDMIENVPAMQDIKPAPLTPPQQQGGQGGGNFGADFGKNLMTNIAMGGGQGGIGKAALDVGMGMGVQKGVEALFANPAAVGLPAAGILLGLSLLKHLKKKK